MTDRITPVNYRSSSPLSGRFRTNSAILTWPTSANSLTLFYFYFKASFALYLAASTVSGEDPQDTDIDHVASANGL